ncbi:MAG: hypothetical protein ACI376_09145 [Candidatus Bruticola sp.]
MLRAKDKNNDLSKFGSLGLICLWLLFFFVPAQGMLWLHPHSSRIFPCEAARFCQIEFFDQADFCSCSNRALHLENTSGIQEDDCSACQIIIQLGQGYRSFLFLPYCCPLPEQLEYYSCLCDRLDFISKTGRSPPSPLGSAI